MSLNEYLLRQLVQGLERNTHNVYVGGSNPSLPTNSENTRQPYEVELVNP